jgi:hypothetical protein
MKNPQPTRNHRDSAHKTTERQLYTRLYYSGRKPIISITKMVSKSLIPTSKRVDSNIGLLLQRHVVSHGRVI